MFAVSTGHYIDRQFRLFFFRSDYHSHETPRHSRRHLHHSDFSHLFGNPLHQPEAEFWMGDLSTTEHDGHFNLVALLKKPQGVSDFDLKVVILSLGSHLDFFDIDTRRLLLGLCGTLARLVLVLAVIHDAADRRVRVGRNLHEIEPSLFRCKQSLADAHNTKHFPCVDDDTDFLGSNGAIDARFLLSYGSTS